MNWANLTLISLIVTLALILMSMVTPRAERVLRPYIVLAFQVFGILLATWLLLAFAHILTLAPQPTPRSEPGNAQLYLLTAPIASVVLLTTIRSLLILGLAAFWATLAGFGAAIALTSLRHSRFRPLGLVAALIWIIPTFLLAILVQELQAFLAGHTGLVLAAGYGSVNAVQIFWAALVLGVRPAVYLFRHAGDTLDLEVTLDYVRTARAKGLPWRLVVQHHIVRAAAPPLLATWMSSFRVMIGSVPLVEYFFGYPGLGRVLILALGVSDGHYIGQIHGDLAGALIVAMAIVLVSVETLVGFLQRRLDPRRLEAELVAA